jgi:hypothetical protein
VTKVRLFSLLITAAMFAMLLANCFHPGGINDGGFW